MTTSDAPPTLAAAELPVLLTRFVGRDRELDDVLALLARSRLLTLTGPGGSGKTRLALEVVHRVAATFARVTWVDLAPLADPDRLPDRLAAALHLGEEAGAAALDTVVAALGDARALVVLDNCEHLVEGCAVLADALLRRCPALVLLATSREAIGAASEVAWPVPPLASAEAVQLFVDRARAAASTFTPRPDDAAAVAEICRRLDGIPLAIELAAARVRVLPPAQIAARLDDALRLLTAGSRTALPRHRTLRATLDWSFALLAPREQALLRRLAVFAGGFTLEAAEAVGGDVPEVLADGADVLDVLSALVDKSLVGVESGRGAVRYHLLETVRQYAHERLVAAGELEAARAVHARHFLALAEAAEPELFAGASRAGLLAEVQVELDNLRAAASWAEEEPSRAPVALRLGFALHWFWWAIGQSRESRHRLEAALALPGEHDPLLRGRAALALGFTMSSQGDVEGVRPRMEEATRLLVGRDTPRNIAYLFTCLSAGCLFAGDVAGAHHFGEQAMATVAAVPPHAVHALARYYHGRAAEAMGDAERARVLFEEAVAIGRGIGHRPAIAHPLSMLGRLALATGDVAAAQRWLAEALEIHVETHDSWGVALALEGLAAAAQVRGQPALATRLTAAADAVRARIHVGQVPAEQATRERRLAEAREALGAAFEVAYAEGRALPVAEVVRLVLAPDPVPDVAPAAVPDPVPDPVPAATPSTAGAARLRVAALGPLEAWVHGEPVPPAAWGSARARELLAYLLLHPDGRTKEQVGLALWPEASMAQLRSNFHVTMHRLRRALGGADAVLLAGERYTINPAVLAAFDVATFEQAVGAAPGDAPAAEALEGALAAWRGDPLEGEAAGEWLAPHRERLRRLYVDACLRLGAWHERAGAPARGATAYARVLACEPLHEEAVLALMRCRAATGEREAALQAYRAFAGRMRAELGSAPGARVARAYAALGGG